MQMSPASRGECFSTCSFTGTRKMNCPTCLKKFEGSAARLGDAMHETRFRYTTFGVRKRA